MPQFIGFPPTRDVRVSIIIITILMDVIMTMKSLSNSNNNGRIGLNIAFGFVAVQIT